jgi:D-alanyl-lipoteichoic acid acyltransferase DltB (MBOAT superfamily)
MSFLSVPFFVFVAIAIIVFQLSPARFRALVLLVASLGFYVSHGPAYAVLLLLVATLAVHQAALAIERREAEAAKLRLVTISVSALTLVLAAFKLGSALFPWRALNAASEPDVALRVLIPLGLSYYLFKLIAYLLEVYWENLPAQRSFVALALYAAFFPQVVSGPIERPGEFFAQVQHFDRLDAAGATQGLRRILFGLFKKIAIADRLAVVVNAQHQNPGAYSSLELLLGAYLFALQLYADFSGVTDLAIGIGQLFGVKAPENFDLPFFSRNLQEYWRRWHMSLTSWLADYLFTPLRMALRDYGRLGLACAVFVNMVAVGVWHGLTWTYLAFGALHGAFLVVSVLTLKQRDAFFEQRPLLRRVRRLTAPLVTFHLVLLGLVIFRADSLGHASQYLSRLVGWAVPRNIPITRLDFKLLGLSPKAIATICLLGGLMECVHWVQRQPGLVRRFVEAPRPYRWAFYYGVVFLTLAMSRLGEGSFIYARF